MSKESKLGLLAIIVLSVHFGFAFLYAAPVELVGEKGKQISASYMLPLFHQNWDLFAPNPPQFNYEVILKNENGDKFNLSEYYLSMHHKYRVTGHGRIHMGLVNLISVADYYREHNSNEFEKISIHLKERIKMLSEDFFNYNSTSVIEIHKSDILLNTTESFEIN